MSDSSAHALKSLTSASVDHTDEQAADLVSRFLKEDESSVLGAYVAFAKLEKEQTVLLILERLRGIPHKYVIAEDDTGHEYIVCMPLRLVTNHRDILRKIRLGTGRHLVCKGGGYVTVGDELTVDGISGEYGLGDHQRARAAFLRAI